MLYPGHLGWGVLPLCREAVGVFYSPSQLGQKVNVIACLEIELTMMSQSSTLTPTPVRLSRNNRILQIVKNTKVVSLKTGTT